MTACVTTIDNMFGGNTPGPAAVSLASFTRIAVNSATMIDGGPKVSDTVMCMPRLAGTRVTAWAIAKQ